MLPAQNQIKTYSSAPRNQYWRVSFLPMKILMLIDRMRMSLMTILNRKI